MVLLKYKNISENNPRNYRLSSGGSRITQMGGPDPDS